MEEQCLIWHRGRRVARTPAVLAGISLLVLAGVCFRCFYKLEFHPGRVEHNVVYGHAGDVDLKMDIYFAPDTGDRPVPAIMFIHGGAWSSGDKCRLTFPQLIPVLLQRGYLVASINYRTAPKYKFPAQIEDAKCAVRFLRRQAAQLHIDSNRIGVEGESAGGQLAALLGLTDTSAGFDGNGGWNGESSQVQAVVDLFGPMNLTEFETVTNNYNRQTIANVFGAKNNGDAILKRASPVNYVSKDAPPFLILHGRCDSMVPWIQSQEFQEKMRATGNISKLITVEKANHGFHGKNISPNQVELVNLIANFFDHVLKNGAHKTPSATATTLSRAAMQGCLESGVALRLPPQSKISGIPAPS
jgi:acetyl esterase/lipase